MQGPVTNNQITEEHHDVQNPAINGNDQDSSHPDENHAGNKQEHGNAPLDSSFPDSHSVFTDFVSLQGLKHDVTLSTDTSGSSEVYDDSEEQLILVLKLGSVKHMKQFLRLRYWMVDHEIRESLWLNLCRYLHKADGDIYEEIVQELFPDDNIQDIALPGFIDHAHLTPYYLTNDGIREVAKILAVLNHMNPDITYCPPVFSLACLFLHYMNSNECFNCLYGLLRCKDMTYLMQTKVAWNASKLVFRDLAKKHAKSGYTFILRQTSNIDSVFDRWIWWIFSDLPFEFVVKIVDCFLLEGVKVLYRVALAVLILYTKYNSKVSGQQQVFGSNHSSNIKHFCETMPSCISITKLLKVAFGIRGLTRKEIKKLQVKNEMYVNSKAVLSNHEISRSQSHRSFHGVTLPLSRSFNNRTLYEFSILFQIHLIWSWLPPRLAVCQPTLLYTSEEHGTSLRTLYSKVEDYHQTIIVIQTTVGEIFGAFCSASWCERKSSNKNLSYFGTGETFVFSLYPKKEKYEWVGILNEDIKRTASMFLAGDNSVMTIGGGSGEAIQLDENLEHCRSERCDTFENEALCATKDFTCKVVEVYGFE
ncbi:hypothetical protein LOTGIDRAFT_141064 [Lottia gigantea]|uniref:TLDc domain-containing protein n=1 Tax=Lottia gigantea TaxID=225164 RepID=V4CE93_LOTGI|nr:hypothetical protein LOTGIDRAFT_141064 [Lottia gigantea]ESP00285.1 hypothetical protein LOTGIDRAFT_141064 [Lottia gigantea]